MKSTTQFSFIFLLFISLTTAYGQGWRLELPAEPEGLHNAKKSSVVATKDGGCLLFTTKVAVNNNTSPEFQVYKYSDFSQEQWKKSHTLPFIDAAVADAKPTNDGGYIALLTVWKLDQSNQEYNSFYVLKIDASANIDWAYEDPSLTIDMTPARIEQTLDGGFAMIIDDNWYSSGSVWLYKISNSGVYQWSHFDSGATIEREYNDLLELQDSTIVVVGSHNVRGGNLPTQRSIRKFDTQGNLIFEKIEQPDGTGNLSYTAIEPYGNGFAIGTSQGGITKTDSIWKILWQSKYIASNVVDLKVTSEKKIIFSGRLGIAQTTVIKIDSIGGLEWEYLYQKVVTSTKVVLSTLGASITSGVRQSGTPPAFGTGDFLLKLTSDGRTFAAGINGVVRYDTSQNCIPESHEQHLAFWTVVAKGPATFYSMTDAQGNYSFNLPVAQQGSTYEISVVPPNELWSLTGCGLNHPIHLTPDSIETYDIPIQTNYLCPYMTVDISSPFLRRCFSNRYHVSYSNQGTIDATNVSITIDFDPKLVVTGSSRPWSSSSGNTYTFAIGNVKFSESGSFFVDIFLHCDSSVLGQTHCVEAKIFPNEICIPPGSNWDGSITHLEGECQTDSIEFIIKNVGSGDMSTPLDYFVFEDNIVMRNGLFQLQINEELKFNLPVSNGSTYQLFGEQAPGYFPTNYLPTIAIEGCGSNGGPFTIGLVNQFDLSNASDAISIDCKQSIGSYDPNDKQASPTGYMANHYIDQNIDLTYLIRFQNVGTDTAFNVVIKDTLSPHLNPASIYPTVSSAPYSLRIEENNILIVTFHDIKLVDSTTNEPDSHGFIQFRISQQDSVPIGAMIYNSAAIYFDFNDPVITNTTFHEVGKDFIQFPADQINLTPTVLLEGAYNLNTNLMEDDLRVNQLIPYQEPYSKLTGFEFPDSSHIGLVITDTLIFHKTGLDAIVDWVLVEFRDPTDWAIVLASKPALLTRAGKVVDIDGFSPVGFGSTPSGSYTIVVRHRNHLPVVYSQPIFVTLHPIHLDFTGGTYTSSQYAFNNGRHALIAGDINHDFRIDALDRSIGWNARNQFGYHLFDSDLDGWNTASDRSILWNNRNIIISVD